MDVSFHIVFTVLRTKNIENLTIPQKSVSEDGILSSHTDASGVKRH